MSHYDCTRNRFNPQNRFIGDIEDGKRYPFACYTKEESDERYARKSVETDVTALAEAVNGKASQADLAALTDTVSTKAANSDLQALAETVSSKANESEAVDIRARLDILEETDIKINSFAANQVLFEKGSSNTVTLTWSLNKTATTQQINGSTVTGTSKSYTGVFSDETYTLVVGDGHTTDSSEINVHFANQIYYGAAESINDITDLEKELSDNINRTVNITAGTGEYIIVAFPSRLGDAFVLADGIAGGFEESTKSVTNTSGFQETYKVFKSINANLGRTLVEIKEV